MSDSGSSANSAPVPKERERWTSKVAFYFAAIGAAVGFGNVWRFPALCADYGGGAFFIPYLMALFLIGIPLLILEISLGQYYQTGDVGVFGSFNRRWRGVGVSSVSCAYMVVTYYSVLIAWVIHAFVDAFGADSIYTQQNTTGSDAITYFYSDIIGMDTLGEDLRPTRVVGANVGYSALAWFIIWACLAGGTKWTGRITYATMGIPIVLLFVFLGKAVSLPGASDGIEQYIGIWDMSVLTERPDVWSEAVSQIFFSIGVTFGIMTAFGSYNDRDQPAVLDSFVIACSNSMFSFIAGFAVFASLGYLAQLEGVDLENLGVGGPGLVFGTWPVVFGSLPGGEHWVRLLFFNFFLLGIDSGFGLLEGSLTAAADTVYLCKYSKATLAAIMSVIGFGFSIIYCTDAGLLFLDTVDFYINFVMLFVGFLESFAAGWIYGLEKQVATFGKWAVFSYFAANFGAVIVACGLWFGLDNAQNAVWAGFLALFLVYLFGIGVTAYFLKKKMDEEPGKWTWKSIFYELTFGNIMELRANLKSTIGFLPASWAVMMKQLIPHLLLILFVNLASSTVSEGENAGEPLFGNYGGYPNIPYQLLGFLVVFFAGFLFLLGLVAPNVYNGLVLIDEKQMLHALDGLDAKDKEKNIDDDSGDEIEEGAPEVINPSDASDQEGDSEIEVSAKQENEVVAA